MPDTISRHALQLQANDIRAFSERGKLPLDPTIYALRAQFSF